MNVSITPAGAPMRLVRTRPYSFTEAHHREQRGCRTPLLLLSTVDSRRRDQTRSVPGILFCHFDSVIDAIYPNASVNLHELRYFRSAARGWTCLRAPMGAAPDLRRSLWAAAG